MLRRGTILKLKVEEIVDPEKFFDIETRKKIRGYDVGICKFQKIPIYIQDASDLLVGETVKLMITHSLKDSQNKPYFCAEVIEGWND